MNGLELVDISKSYGEIHALQAVSISLEPGELVVVLGPSGCGKTTLLRVVAGLERPSCGSVLIEGDDVTSLAPGRRDVAMVFQSQALFPHMTVAENIAFGLIVRDVGKAEARARVVDAARLTGCDDLLERRPDELSGGQRQRVALARAVAREPRLLLLDEPLSNLDVHVRTEIRGELRRVHEQLARTTLHVTHDQAEALVLGDRVAVLRDGRLQQVADPEALWRRPANRFVAQFVGSPAMNILPADGPFRFEGVPRDGAREIGIRPEDVVRSDSGVSARVSLVEVIGNDAYVHLAVDALSLVARLPSALRPNVGETLRVSADPERVHVFDATTGARV
jgi:ABC-type sugar transport system ATPase subunit